MSKDAAKDTDADVEGADVEDVDVDSSEVTADVDAQSAEDAEVAEDSDVASKPDRRAGGAPSPRPGASAASRARRIGGRPTTGRLTADDDLSAKDGDPEDAPKSTDAKPARTARVRKPGKSVSLGKAAAVDDEDDVSGRRRKRDEPLELPAWARWAPAAILTAGVIAMAIVLFVASGGVWRDKPAASGQRDRVLAAAKTCVAATSTYRYTELDKYKKRAGACTTGQFKKDFAKAVDSVVDKLAPQTKATSTAQINKAGVQSVVDGQWTIVLYGQVSITNSTTPKGRLDPFGAVALMEKKNGKWAIAKLDLINRVNS